MSDTGFTDSPGSPLPPARPSAPEQSGGSYCPECAGVLELRATRCRHCGYDFPVNRAPVQDHRDFAYSTLADVALIVGTMAAGLGCAITVLRSLSALLDGDLLGALVIGPIAFFVQLAMVVVFVRVQQHPH